MEVVAVGRIVWGNRRTAHRGKARRVRERVPILLLWAVMFGVSGPVVSLCTIVSLAEASWVSFGSNEGVLPQREARDPLQLRDTKS